jgi:hypothetical protein
MFTPRSSLHMPIARNAQIIVESALEPSTMAASMIWPLPDRSRSHSADRMPTTRNIEPPPKSPTRLSGGTGRSPARPIACSTPLSEM